MSQIGHVPHRSQVSRFGHPLSDFGHKVYILRPKIVLVSLVLFPAVWLYFYLYNPTSFFLNYHTKFFLIAPAFWIAACAVGYELRKAEEKSRVQLEFLRNSRVLSSGSKNSETSVFDLFLDNEMLDTTPNLEHATEPHGVENSGATSRRESDPQ